ncbi:hypothetical protein [Labrenzia sp. 011]|uniref:hypothetical protein n=1 Tax=Labrenzia sp. 011 TaxID=2171494 RepID=UPI000D5112B3|nr:hypothetical protein [Labrenzia sp. 011]PVB63463.1 hypothetical protein DCO57_01265 [Labrenzia sp. 011]
MPYPGTTGLTVIAFLAQGAACLPSLADGTDCVTYATDYANTHMGSGDVVGDAVDGGMTGAVAGGAWRGPSGAHRGARAGAALGVMDNLGSMPGGWQALYDTAYQMCQQQTSGVNAAPLYPSPNLGAPNADCRSSVTVDAPLRKTPDGSITAGSGFGNCQ